MVIFLGINTMKSLCIKNPETVTAIYEIAKLEERRPHDTAERLFRKAAKSKLARLKRK
jgi:hypothetical protein